MEVEYELTTEDLTAFQRYHQKHPLVPAKRGLESILIWVAVLFVVIAFFALRSFLDLPLLDELTDSVPAVLAGVGLGAAGIILYVRFIQPNLTRKALQEGRNAEKTLAPRRTTIDPHSIRTTTTFGAGETFWEGVDAVVATRDHVFVYITTRTAHVVPRRGFASDRDFDDFVDMARRYHRMGGVAPAPSSEWHRSRPTGVLPPAAPGEPKPDEGIVAGTPSEEPREGEL